MSFNRSMWHAVGHAIGHEARALMNAGLAQSTYWAPVVNLAREPCVTQLLLNHSPLRTHSRAALPSLYSTQPHPSSHSLMNCACSRATCALNVPQTLG